MLEGKRYVQLDPTISLQSNTLLAVQIIGEPELSKIIFEDFQKNVKISNLFDIQGEVLGDKFVIIYDQSEEKFVTRTLTLEDVPSLPISKITDLTTSLEGKEPSFQKGSITSTTISITNGIGRLFGSADLELEVDLSSIVNFVPQTRTITLQSLNESIRINDASTSTQDLTENLVFDISFIPLTANDGVQRTTNNLSVDSTVLRTGASEQVRTGLLRLRRGIAGELLHTSFEYPDGSGEDYNLRLYNNSLGNNVRWYFKQKVSFDLYLGSGVLDIPVIGFKNGITIIGSDSYSSELGIENYFNEQTPPFVRHPMTLYNEGEAYLSEGIKTKAALDDSFSSVIWKLGNAIVHSGSAVPSHEIYVRIDGTLFTLFAKQTIQIY